MGGELLDKNPNILRKLAKIFALLLEPLSGPAPLQPAVAGEAAVMFVPTAATVWDYIQSFVSLIFPSTHPSNNGRWSQPISHFVSAFIQAYTRRVARERMSSSAVKESVGRLCEGPPDERIPILSYRLGRAEDEKLADLFLPVMLQGIYSKNPTAGASYETSIKRVCTLLPESSLERVLDQLMSSLEAVTESHQLQASLRLLTQLVPLTIQRMPGVIPQLLTLTLPAIDGAEPFKTVQALTFYSVLFSNIGCQDLTSTMEVDEFPIDQASDVRLKPRKASLSQFVSFD